MGRRAADVFLIGEEDLLADRMQAATSDRAADAEGDWVPFEEEQVVAAGPRRMRARPVWLRRSVLALAVALAAVLVAQRAIVSGASAVASGHPVRGAGGPLVLGPRSGARRRSVPRRRTVAVRPARARARRSRRSAAPGSRTPRAHHQARAAVRHVPHRGSEEVGTDAVEERETTVEEAPQSAPVELVSPEAPPVEPVMDAQSAPDPAAAAPAQGEGGGSGADDFGFER